MHSARLRPLSMTVFLTKCSCSISTIAFVLSTKSPAQPQRTTSSTSSSAHSVSESKLDSIVKVKDGEDEIGNSGYVPRRFLGVYVGYVQRDYKAGVGINDQYRPRSSRTALGKTWSPKISRARASKSGHFTAFCSGSGFSGTI